MILGIKIDEMLPYLEKLLDAKNVFVRNRKKRRTGALGILLYHFGLFLRKCRIILSSFEDISQESIRQWYHITGEISSVDTCFRETIAIDEIKLKINEKLYIVWTAIDINTLEILGFWIMNGRCSFEAYSFLKQVLEKCYNNANILVDDGPCYKPALNRLHFW